MTNRSKEPEFDSWLEQLLTRLYLWTIVPKGVIGPVRINFWYLVSEPLNSPLVRFGSVFSIFKNETETN
jgi:hypothetical protein